MATDLPEATDPIATRTEVFVRYLDYFRGRLIDSVEALPSDELRKSRVASGWTPLELVKHLRHVERRWLEWGFEGIDVGDPWADNRDDRWYVAEDETRAGLIADLTEQGERTRAIVESHDLADIGRPSDRWDGNEPPTLERVLFHLMQEYARHVGHLDIVCELAAATSEN